MLILLSTLTLAAPSSGRPPGPPPLEPILDTLDLDAATRTQVDALVAEAKLDLDALHAERRAREDQLMTDIRALLTAEEFARLEAAMPPRPSRDSRPADR